MQPNIDQNKIDLRTSLRNLWGIVHVMWQVRPLALTGWTLLLLFTSAIPAIQIWLQKASVDAISTVSAHTAELLPLLLLVSSIYGLHILNSILSESSEYLFNIVKEDTNFHLQRSILLKSLCVPYYYYEDARFHDEVSMVSQAVSRSGADVIRSVVTSFSNIVSLVTVVVMLSIVHWSLPILLISSTLPGIIILLIAKKKRYRLAVATTQQSREVDYTLRLMLSKHGAKEIRIFQLGDALIERWTHLFVSVRSKLLKQYATEGRGRIAGVVILQLSALTVAIILVMQINKNVLTIGDYVALMSAVVIVQSTMGSIGASLGQVFEMSLYVKHLYQYLALPEASKLTGELKFPRHYEQLSVSGLHFTYPNTERKVLTDISFRVKRGETIAIVGENGAGKTTLMNCLLGLYTPSQGNIYIDKEPLQNFNIDSYLNHVSAVFQQFVQYNYSVHDNVAFGAMHKKLSQVETLDALASVGLTEMVHRLSEGMGTRLGSDFMGGIELSGGQWQRIAIARAAVRDAEILILDEPTSALDPLAELEIFRTFQKLAAGRTAFMVSHRLGPARLADRILVLKNGVLVEQGSHDELIQLGGEYKEMYQAQAQWYQEERVYDVVG
ncbi:HlyB/MsbA family ABC transporter [Paenibacillus baekrokdamisoli]|uniref:HlyB/MsbA family ABC transporter n=2 Tax=Paenibacillus baekrokdamisoli TaxID=1712516 RepID=A0A3G9JGF8_9BACL|nr:ABC-type multidrug transport system fused ATPase/permease subunit [Paenibacillus baekrokdamisoli]BBH22059.1 HlyB/MsbA family ABC transporter [Paenibacillus baekrokdamisoli]